MDIIDILTNVMYTAVVIVSFLLICLVLVQPSKSGGMGAAFGGIGQSVFGAQAGSHLTKLTVVFITVFFVLTLALAFLVGHKSDRGNDPGARLSEIAAEQEAASAVGAVEEAILEPAAEAGAEGASAGNEVLPTAEK